MFFQSSFQLPHLHFCPLVVGATCLERYCQRKPILFSDRPREPVSKAQCDCQTTGNAQCPASAGGPKPSQWDSFTGDKLQNLTGRNMTDYLLKTYGKFIRRRYDKHFLLIADYVGLNSPPPPRNSVILCRLCFFFFRGGEVFSSPRR